MVNASEKTRKAWTEAERYAHQLTAALLELSESFIGLELKDVENPVELYHVVRSHDACLVCTVHFLRPDKVTTFHV